MRILFISLVLISITSCSKDPVNNTPADDSIYTAPGEISELIWLADNQSVIINYRIGGNIYIFNTVTKTERTWNAGANFLVQWMYYSKDVPGKAFFTTLSRSPGGSWVMPIQLYSLDLATLTTVLVRDNITEIPTGGNYRMGTKKMAIRDPAGTILINLETGTSQLLNVIGDVQAVAPDDNRLLFYSNYSNPISNSFIYDVSSSASTPYPIAGEGKAFWRAGGLFGYGNGGSSWNLNMQSFQGGGSIIKSFPDYIAGPWIANNDHRTFLYVKGTTWSSNQDAMLISYDPLTGRTRELAHAPFPLYSSYIKGIFLAAASPDGTKLAYVLNGSKVKLLSL